MLEGFFLDRVSLAWILKEWEFLMAKTVLQLLRIFHLRSVPDSADSEVEKNYVHMKYENIVEDRDCVLPLLRKTPIIQNACPCPPYSPSGR